MRSMNVSLVTRCHNAFELTNEFLLSWGNQLDDFFEVIVVDDGSTPDIHSRLVEKWGQSVTIIKTEKIEDKDIIKMRWTIHNSKRDIRTKREAFSKRVKNN